MKTPLFLFSLLILINFNLFGQSVVVNKYFNSGITSPGGQDDVVELLIIQNNLDIRGMIIKDFSSSMANDGGGKYEFSNHSLWRNMNSGTLIIIRVQNTSSDIDPTDYILDVGLTDSVYFTKKGTGSFDIATTDMLMIKSAGSGEDGVTGSIHVLAGGTAGAQFTNAPAPKLRATGTSGTARFVYANNSTSSLSDFNGT
ncbi:MAG: hypothetical protein KJ666_00185, partial [Bacteroidetes bacterium]|nr:hypothetical protein [Bacteroidota bacterium]